jgi:quinol monooxygenase YgiN
MISVTGTLACATPDEAAIVRAYLPEHIRLSRAEPGCLKFNVVPTEDPLVWRLDEAFVDRQAFEAHQTRTRDSVWFQVSSNLGRDFQIEETWPSKPVGQE